MAVKPFLPVRHPLVVGALSLMSDVWQEWARSVHSTIVSINQIPGVNRKTYVELNALGLGASDEGYVAWEPDYGHALRWTGTIWTFAPGDPGNGFFALRPVAPQEVGWQLCDGTASNYLTVGTGTLSVTSFTTPNVTAGTFLKVLAAYTGAIDAAIAPGISGTTASVGVALTYGVVNVDINADGLQTPMVEGPVVATAHDHGTGSLSVNSASRPPSLGGLLYFRR